MPTGRPVINIADLNPGFAFEGTFVPFRSAALIGEQLFRRALTTARVSHEQLWLFMNGALPKRKGPSCTESGVVPELLWKANLLSFETSRVWRVPSVRRHEFQVLRVRFHLK